jgi:YidC/Oxa1 family membrane protein insertase
MANFRPVLFVTLLFLSYLLYDAWDKDYGSQPVVGEPTQQGQDSPAMPNGAGVPVPGVAAIPGQESGDLPSLPVASSGQVADETIEPAAQEGLITVTTDVLRLQIDPVGGTVVTAQLQNYPFALDIPEHKVQLFDASGRGDFYIAQSGVTSTSAAPDHQAEYQARQTEYHLAEGDEQLLVPLTWTGPDGLSATKEFVLRPGHYAIEVRHSVTNNGQQPWTGSRYEQLQRAIPGDSDSGGFALAETERYSFNGIGFYSPAEKLEKVDFEDVVDEPVQFNTSDGWLSMIQHYFFSAWIPPAGEINRFEARDYSPGGQPRVIARSVAPSISIEPGQSHEFSSTLYVGPKLQDQLAEIAPGLDLTVNYGIFTIFSAPLFWLLSWIYSFVGNWGWAIVLLTVLIKLAFFKLTEAQYKSMARMRKLQPRIEKLKERYGDDRQAMSQAMMAMYKEEKVNPLGGCLPILVQIPIFIALYWVLLESVELRQAPFILWIDNLSVRDPYFILPLLNAAFMFATQRLTPMVGMDPLQKKMMQAMPLVFSVMFAFFPAGLVLYWATNAGLSLAQQWYITRKIAAAD